MQFAEHPPTAKGPAEIFTGDVWFDVIHAWRQAVADQGQHGPLLPRGTDLLAPPRPGQALHVVSGVGLVGTRDGVVFEAHPG